MRCYHLSNMYLSSIQHGVQSAHAQMELFVKYKSPGKKNSFLFDWAENHKTMIVLNGGYLSSMNEALEFFSQPDNPYPFVQFYESDEALGGILTNIAIVLPEKIYKTAELRRKRLINDNNTITDRLDPETYNEINELITSFDVFSKFESELCSFMNNFGLAN